MQIAATARTEQLISDLMSTGRYRNVSDLVEAAVTALADRESFGLIRDELENVEQRLTPEFVEAEEEAFEELAHRFGRRGPREA